eukprot:SAG31_NODE_18652_length_627_cov_3.431818_1_plen_41_part_01
MLTVDKQMYRERKNVLTINKLIPIHWRRRFSSYFKAAERLT